MSQDSIYLVKELSKELQEIAPVTFSDIGIKERKDLQPWVAAYSRILGEELLILDTEYSRFTNSGRRVDLLALDKQGFLVVVELKLEMEQSHAELQAIRYAAMCAQMTMDDVVDTLVHSDNTNREIAIKKN